MILITVGTQGPFERLVKTVDAWAGGAGSERVLAQVGIGGAQYRHVECVEQLSPDGFRTAMTEARVVIAHAGMGTILAALEFEKPLLVMPRRAALGEQRNDHQLATATRFAERGLVTVAYDEHDLAGYLDRLDELEARSHEESTSTHELLGRISDFLQAG